MSKIVVIGGTGFAGSHIVQEAARRGHSVVSVSRSLPTTPLDNVRYVQGSATSEQVRRQALEGAEVIVGAVSPRADMAGKVAPLYAELADEAATRGARLVIIGGFSSLRPAAGQPRFVESGDVPAEYLAEALEIAGIFDSLKANAPKELSWVFISPAAVFGAYATVPDFGTYRLGTDVALFDEAGESKISGADFALGVMDEIEHGIHTDENISLVH